MPEEQRMFHIITEALAIPVGIFLIYMGLTVQAKQWKKVGLVIIGAGNIIIDGYLLMQWVKQ